MYSPPLFELLYHNMMSTKGYFNVLFLVLTFAHGSLTCKDGYSLKVNKIENCAGPDGIITISENTAITMHDDCSISMEGCVKVKQFNTADGTATVTKNGREMFSKPLDLCKMGSKIPFLKEFLPGGACPQNDNEICADPNKKMSMDRFKKMMGIMKGSLGVELKLDHDTGKSCIKLEAEISK